MPLSVEKGRTQNYPRRRRSTTAVSSLATVDEIEQFTEAVGTVFRTGGDGAVALRLDDCAAGTPREGPGRRIPFTLQFTGPLAADAHLEQATYLFDHEQLGELAIFIVPLGPDGEGRMRYEAVFN